MLDQFFSKNKSLHIKLMLKKLQEPGSLSFAYMVCGLNIPGAIIQLLADRLMSFWDRQKAVAVLKKRLVEDEGMLTPEVLSQPGLVLTEPIEPGTHGRPYVQCDCVSDTTPEAWEKGTNEKIAALALRTCRPVPQIDRDSRVWSHFQILLKGVLDGLYSGEWQMDDYSEIDGPELILTANWSPNKKLAYLKAWEEMETYYTTHERPEGNACQVFIKGEWYADPTKPPRNI